MKFFHKKPVPDAPSRKIRAATESCSEFYARNSRETPLDEDLEKIDFQQIRRASRHAPRKLRKINNGSDWRVFLLLLRAGVIVALLVGGYVALKAVFGRLAKPTEKNLQEWAAAEALMEKSLAVDSGLAEVLQETGTEVALTAALLEDRLSRWQNAGRFLRTAEDLYRRGIQEEAVRQINMALRAAPANSAAQRLLLKISMNSGAYEDAIPLCLRLLEKEATEWSLRQDLLVALMHTGPRETTLLLAENMLQEQPNNVGILEIAANAYVAENQTELAMERFARILENERSHVVALKGIGRLYCEQGQWEGASPYYRELIRVAPQAEYYHALATCYAQQDEVGKVVILMGQAASLYGEKAIAGWFDDAVFDQIRETGGFRALIDQVVGVEARRALEAIGRREKKKETLEMPGMDAPVSPAFDLKGLSQ